MDEDYNIEKRWETKREAIYNMKKNLDRLKRQVSKDIIYTQDEKEQLTAVIIRIMFNTSERVGNETSAENGHFGITQLKPKHVFLMNGRITLKYKGKSGVDHIKHFSDPIVYKILKKLKSRNPEYLFTTEDGFRIRPDRVNRYLKRYDSKSKDIRGFNANRMMASKLKGLRIKEPRERVKVFNAFLKQVAEKIGHGPATLRKHYLLPEIEENFYSKGTIGRINL